MIQVVPLTRELLRQVEPQPMQAMTSDMEAIAFAAPLGTAWAALYEGRPVLAAGIVEYWPGRAHCWALLSSEAGRHMLAITRAIRSELDALPCRRVEMAVDAEFLQAIRWAYMLGFSCETPVPMRRYTPDGRAAYLFARVR